MTIPVLSVVAKSGTGKTTLLERVIPKLKERGIIVAVIKHDAHNFEIDKPGKDSWRLAQAGADIVAISSKEKFAYIDMRGGEQSLEQLVNTISGVDIILTEGFRTVNMPKIEVYRQ
jgi:molybdopterin-guanine dinucleotide biosynthesis protein B